MKKPTMPNDESTRIIERATKATPPTASEDVIIAALGELPEPDSEEAIRAALGEYATTRAVHALLRCGGLAAARAMTPAEFRRTVKNAGKQTVATLVAAGILADRRVPPEAERETSRGRISIVWATAGIQLRLRYAPCDQDVISLMPEDLDDLRHLLVEELAVEFDRLRARQP